LIVCDNITQWTEKGLMDVVRMAENREAYRRFVYAVAYARSPGIPINTARPVDIDSVSLILMTKDVLQR